MKAHQNTTDTRIALLEQSIGHINDTLKSIDKRFDKIDKRFDKIDEQFTEMRKESRIQFWCTISFIIALIGLPIIQNIITHFWGH